MPRKLDTSTPSVVRQAPLELIDAAQENLSAAFDFARQLPEVKSPSLFFEASAGEVRKQFENLTRQSQHLTGLAQKVVADTVQCG